MKKMAPFRFSTIPAAIAVFALAASSCAMAATLSGTVRGQNGQPIAAVLQLHDLSTKRSKGAKPFDTQFASKTDGTFSVPNVPMGTYEVCVDAPQSAVLDPCEWTPGHAPPVTVGPGNGNGNANGITQTVEIQVSQGYALQVHLDDPQQLLTKSGAVAGDNSVIIRVQGADGRNHNSRMLSVTATGQDRYLVIPYNQPVTMTAISPTTSAGSSAVTLKNTNSWQNPALSGTTASGGTVSGVTSTTSAQGGGATISSGAASPVATPVGPSKILISVPSGQKLDPVVFSVGK